MNGLTEGQGATVVNFGEAVRVWARIGFLGFGGPAGQIALMHAELVEKRRWISESRFLHALNFCMLLPGPEAMQLAVYIGWLMHRTLGGIIAGLLFVLPGALLLAVLSAIYVAFGTVPWIAALFFGLKAAILAVVVDALLRIGRRALTSRFLVIVAGLAFVAIFVFRVPFPWLVIAAAVLGVWIHRWLPTWLPAAAIKQHADDTNYVIDRQLAEAAYDHTKPSWKRTLLMTLGYLVLWFLPVVLAMGVLGRDHVITHEGWFFSQTAVVTFGGAYAVLAYVGQNAVYEFGWLRPSEMIDGLALAETTPGPLVLVLQFVGFVAAYHHPGDLNPWLAGALGAALTTWVTFVPSFLFIFVGAPFVESLRQRRDVHAALSTITAAVVGVILNLSVWFVLHTIFAKQTRLEAGPIDLELPVWDSIEPGAAVLASVAMIAMLRFKLGLGWTLLGSAILGAGYFLLRSAS